MAPHRLLFSQALPDRATPRAQLSGIAQRDLLPQQDRLPVAQSARELCPVGHGLSLLPNLEAQRFVGRHSHPLAGTGTPSGRAQTKDQRGHHRQPECQEHRDERRAGLRRRQKSQRTQAAYPGRYDRLAKLKKEESQYQQTARTRGERERLMNELRKKTLSSEAFASVARSCLQMSPHPWAQKVLAA